MLNEFLLQGRLVADPVLNQAGQISVCNIDIVSNKKYKDKETTLFMPCVFWGKTAEFLVNNFEKGQEILVSGELFNNSWVDTNGKNRKDIKLKVVDCYFCGSRKNKEVR